MVGFCTYHQIDNTSQFEFCTDVVGEGYREAPHFHKNFEILTVVRGKCHCEIGDKHYDLREGDAALVVPFQIHDFSPTVGSEVRRVTFHNHLIWSLDSAMDKKKPKDPVFRPSVTVGGFFSEQICAMYGREPVHIHRIPARQRMMVKGCLYIIGNEMLNQATLVPLQSADAAMIDVVQYVADHFRSDVSLQDIAKEKGYSYCYLSRTFNRIFGINFKTMLNQYRMEYAYSLLQDTHMSMSEIAFESGFQSIRSFDHVCREIYGRTPGQMRRGHYV